MRGHTHTTVALILVMVGASLFLPAVTPAAADEEPETADDYFNELRTIEDLEVYSEYGELKTVHTQSLSAVQVGEFTDAEARELDAVMRTLRLFEDARQQFEAGDFEAGLETAMAIEAEIDELETYDEPLAALSTLALTRYYEQIGDELAAQAEETENTPEEIELRGMAASAYEGANDPTQAAEYTRQVEQLEAELSADREQMDDAEAAMTSFEGACSACENPASAIRANNIGIIDHYRTSLAVTPALSDAVQRAERHGLSDRQSALQEQSATATSMQFSLAIASGALLVGYGAGLAAIVAVLMSRLFAWKQAFEAANLDSVVTVGGRDV